MFKPIPLLSLVPLVFGCSIIHTIISLIFFLGSPISSARDYYVDSRVGLDTNDGSRESPFQTLSKINALSLQPGDAVLLKRGSLWRESLLLTASGTAENPIRIVAYGDSEKSHLPVISCARDITSLLWPGIIANGGFEDIQQQPDTSHLDCYCNQAMPALKKGCTVSNVFSGWSSKGNGIISIDPDKKISINGQSARLSSTKSFISLKSDPFTFEMINTYQKPDRYRLKGFIRAGSGAEVEVSLIVSGVLKKYLGSDGRWHDWQTDKRYRPFVVSEQKNLWESFDISFSAPLLNKADKAQKKSLQTARIIIAVRGSNDIKAWIDDISLIDTANKKWSVNTVDNHSPKILLENDVRLAHGKDFNKENYRWHATNQKKIYYSPLTSELDPKTKIELSQRRVGIRLKGASHIVIEDIEIKACGRSLSESMCDGAAMLLASGSSNNIVRGVRTIYNDAGIRVEGKGSAPSESNDDNHFIDVYSAFNRSAGVALRNHAKRNVFSNCIVHDIGMFESDLEGQDIEPISLGGNIGLGKGNIIENCEIFNSRISGKAPAPGINAFNAPETIIRNNFVHNIGSYGISVASASHNSEVYNNVIKDTGKGKQSAGGQGIYVKAASSDTHGVKIFNNTVYDCTNRKAFFGGISLLGDKKCRGEGCFSNEEHYLVSDTVVLNNIVYGCSGKYPFAYYAANIDFAGLVSDYNIFYAGTRFKKGNIILFRGGDYEKNSKTPYTYWSSLLSYQLDSRNKKNNFDQNSMELDPLLMFGDEKKIRLDVGSPAIGSGVDLKKLGIELLQSLPPALNSNIGADFLTVGPKQDANK